MENNIIIIILMFFSTCSQNFIDAIKGTSIENNIQDEETTKENELMLQFLYDELELNEKELSEAENKLSLFQQNENIYSIKDNSELLFSELAEVESQLYTKKAKLNIILEREKFISNQLSDNEKKLIENVSSTINLKLSALRKEIASKESELISTISQQGEEHTLVDDLKAKIKKLKENIETMTRQYISRGISVADPIQYRQSLMDTLISISSVTKTLESEITQLNKLVKQYKLKSDSLPEKFSIFKRLTREVDILTRYNVLLRYKINKQKFKINSTND